MDKIFSKVLLVEDEALVAHTIRAVLGRHNIGVCAIEGNGDNVMPLVELHLPDLVLMDIKLRGKLDGIEVAEQITSRHDIPIIFITSFADPDTFSRMLGVAPYGYISKPFAENDLIAALRMARSRRQAELRGKHAEDKYREFFEQSKDAIMITSQDGDIVDMNDSARKLFEINAESFCMTGMKAEDFYYYPSARREIMARIRRTGSLKGFDVILRSTTGSKLYTTVTTSMVYSAEKMTHELFSIIHDETESVLLQEQLRHSQKMEAVGQLAGGIAHDFNNILQGIMGYEKLLSMKLRDDDPLKHYVSEIGALSRRAARLTSDLLAFSRRQRIELEAVELNGVVAGIRDMLERLIGDDVKLSIEQVAEPLVLCSNSAHLDQVLVNLAVNARDAMPRGGIITITTRRFNSEMAELLVCDTGEGIDKAYIDRIFDPFFTTKPVGKGTGLGLSIVYGIVTGHKGEVRVESSSGQGTCVIIKLPLWKSVHPETDVQ